uniref:Uncharacterized protein n=1 Tax=Oryza meridionalis TaxID=40149 RepID=A0A0E0CZ12_9ORYZ
MPNNSSSGRRKNAVVLLLTNHSQGPGLNAVKPCRDDLSHRSVGPAASWTHTQSSAQPAPQRPTPQRPSKGRGHVDGGDLRCGGVRGVWKPADLGRSPPESGTGGGIQVADWVQHMLFLTLGV